MIIMIKEGTKLTDLERQQLADLLYKTQSVDIALSSQTYDDVKTISIHVTAIEQNTL